MEVLYIYSSWVNFIGITPAQES